MDDDNGHVKRSDEEILHKIVSKDSWVIEDVGRKIFIEGRERVEIIYYIKLSRIKSYLRVTKRWFRQRFGNERYNHPPN